MLVRRQSPLSGSDRHCWPARGRACSPGWHASSPRPTGRGQLSSCKGCCRSSAMTAPCRGTVGCAASAALVRCRVLPASNERRQRYSGAEERCPFRRLHSRLAGCWLVHQFHEGARSVSRIAAGVPQRTGSTEPRPRRHIKIGKSAKSALITLWVSMQIVTADHRRVRSPIRQNQRRLRPLIALSLRSYRG
jgi:hypothetical protein